MRKLLSAAIILFPMAAQAFPETPEQVAANTGVAIANEEFATPEAAQEVKSQGAMEYITRRCSQTFAKNANLRQPCMDAAYEQDASNFKAAMQQEEKPMTFIQFVSDGTSTTGKHVTVVGSGSCLLKDNVCLISTKQALASGESGLPVLGFSVSAVKEGSPLRNAIVQCSELTKDICDMQVSGTIVKKDENVWVMTADALYITPPTGE